MIREHIVGPFYFIPNLYKGSLDVSMFLFVSFIDFLEFIINYRKFGPTGLYWSQ